MLATLVYNPGGGGEPHVRDLHPEGRANMERENPLPGFAHGGVERRSGLEC